MSPVRGTGQLRSELATALHEAAACYENLVKQGAELVDPVNDGHVRYEIPGHEVEVKSEEDDILCAQCYEVIQPATPS